MLKSSHRAPEGGSHASSVRIFMVLGALLAFVSIPTGMYLPALPALAVAFNAEPGHVQLTLSSFLIGFSLGQLVWGPIGDRYGRRLPVAIGLVLFMLGSAGCALSDTAWQMIGWRVVQALGACAGPVLARAMVRDLYTRDRAAQVLSALMLIMNMASLLGPILGSQILAVWSWHGIFWTLVGFGVLALAGLLSLPETLPQHQRNSQGLTKALGRYFVLVRNRRLIGYALSGGFYYAGIYAYLAGTPFAYIDYYDLSPQAYSLLFGINVVGMMAANLLNTRLVMRLGSDRIFRFGTAIAALSGLALAVNAWFGWGGVTGLAVPLFIYISVAGLIAANSVAGALSAYPHEAGAVSALVGAMHYGVGVPSAAMISWFADATPWTMGWIIGLGGIGTFLTAVRLVRSARPA